MSVIGSNILAGASGQAGYNLSNSLRFRSSASAYLNRTPASAGNQQKWTWSGWVKRGSINASFQRLFSSKDSSNDDADCLRFNSGETFSFLFRTTPNLSFTGNLTTTQVFRDPSAWYHIVAVLDTTQATSSNRMKLYVNGTQITSFSTATYPTQNDNGYVNSTNLHTIGNNAASLAQNFDGYLAETNFIDGQALTPSSFGETSTSTGVWIPKKYSGTYGTNGFYLPFTDNSALTTSSNVGLGKDFSGNGNYWTTNNISITAGTTYDSMTDVPTLTSATTANYCVLNPLDDNPSLVLSNGNLNASIGSASWVKVRATFGMPTGKWYFEYTPTSADSHSVGIMRASDSLSGILGAGSFEYGYWQAGYIYAEGGLTAVATYTTNDVIGITFDAGTGEVKFYKNNTLQATDTVASTEMYFPALSENAGNGAMNFGQRPFSYTPPTGFKALNTFNLPTPTIGATASTTANKYMDVLLHTGNGGSQSITGLNFSPDFWWVKSRNLSGSHCLFDQIRGANSSLFSELTLGENNNWTGQSFNSNGVTADAAYSYQTNGTGYTFVDWFWKANGAGSSNTAGSITSTVSASTTAGFSIVTYTGTGANATVGHGLGVAPSMVIVKNRDAADAWQVYHAANTANPETDYLVLNTTAATADAADRWNDTLPTSTVFSIGNGVEVNTNTEKYVAYCFAQVAGYSAFGSYTGNGSTDGPFVFTGFRPRYVMIKQTSTSGEDWYISDTSRDTYNQSNIALFADLSNAEASNSARGLDILSNGIKLRGTSSANNASGATYIYMAFAENPFKYANAR